MRKNQQKKFMDQYQKVHEPFTRFCTARSYGIIEVEDLINESILKAYEKFNEGKIIENLEAYLVGIAKNIINTKLRKKKLFFDFSETRTLISEEITAEKRLEIEHLYKTLKTLPPSQEEAIILFEISGFSIKEIMEIQECSESAVKQRLKRGRAALAEKLQIAELKKEPLHLPSVILSTLF